MKKMRMESLDMTAQNIDKIAALFPNCITETLDENGKPKKAINFELLKQMLSADVIEGNEAYEFTWVGKKAAIVEAHRPIRKTLRPCKEESVNWDTTENLYIEGDNLEVLKLLQESYLGAIKMIYIDPPYNTGNDFVYRDDFKQSADDYEEDLGVYDEDGNRMFKNSDSNGRFHSDWCSMMYSRLLLARNLLTEDGVIFISIDDNEVENCKKLCNEIFGEVNFEGALIWKTKTAAKGVPTKNMLVQNHDYILVFSNLKRFRFNGEKRNLHDFSNPDNDPRGLWKADNMKSTTSTNSFSIVNPKTGESYMKPWAFSKETIQQMIAQDKIIWPDRPDGTPRQKKFLSEMTNETTPLRTLIGEFQSETATNKLKELFDDKKIFSFPKHIDLMKLLITQASASNSTILDFFSGSATTAHAVMQLNAEDGGHRKFIMVQLQELCDEKSEAFKAGYKNICEIGKERIRRAGNKLLNDQSINPSAKSMPNAANSIPNSENSAKTSTKSVRSLDIGFRVFKLADSNMRDVYYSPQEYSQDLLSQLESNVKADRTDLDLLFGCLLEWGLPLSLPYTSERIEGCTVHTYNDGDLIACFDENIPGSVIKTIAKKQPLRAVFRDSSFANSPSKINVGEVFKLLAPDTRVKVI